MEQQPTAASMEALGKEQALAAELWQSIDSREHWLALNPVTVAATLERYQGDELGTAMAVDITHALAPELPLDGSLEDMETEPVDEIVTILRANDLAGMPIEEIASALGVNLDMGALEGIMTIHAVLSDPTSDALELLREQYAVTAVQAAEEEAELEQSLERRFKDTEYGTDESEEIAWDDEDVLHDSDLQVILPPTIVQDDSGEEFEI